MGKKFGLWPESEEDVWHAEQINATVHDYIAEGMLNEFPHSLLNACKLKRRSRSHFSRHAPLVLTIHPKVFCLFYLNQKRKQLLIYDDY